MASSTRSPGAQTRKRERTWPFRAMSLFLLIVIVIYVLMFLTGDRSGTPKLGIDLQGGTRVTLVPQGESPSSDQLAKAREILENRVNGMGVSGAEVVTDGDTLVITVPGEDTSEARAVGQTSKLVFRPVSMPQEPDLESYPKILGEMANRWLKYGVITKEQAEHSISGAIDALKQALGDKADSLKAPKITAETLPETTNSIEAAQRRQEVTDMLKKDRQSEDPTTQAVAAGLLNCDGSADPLAGTDDPALPLIACSAKGEDQQGAMVLGASPLLEGQRGEQGERLTGNEIDTSKPISGGYDQNQGIMAVSFQFKTGGGAEAWSTLTSQLETMGGQVAITLDSQVISAPRVESATPVGAGTQITGQFSNEEAQQLANNLKYGALPLSFAGENGEQGGTAETIPASLGEASLKAGLIAGVVGLALIALFVFAYYRLFGLISLFTLFCSGILVYGALVLLGRWIGYSLDLSGVAGLIIGLGATADSFVVMYERIKDEVRDGYSFRSATRRGWERAKRTVVTGNLVTLIGSVVIYFLAVGEVKGFAFTLGMTTVFDLVVTFMVTAPLMILASRKKFWARGSINGMSRVMKIGEAHRRTEEKRMKAELEAGEPKVAARSRSEVTGPESAPRAKSDEES